MLWVGQDRCVGPGFLSLPVGDAGLGLGLGLGFFLEAKSRDLTFP